MLCSINGVVASDLSNDLFEEKVDLNSNLNLNLENNVGDDVSQEGVKVVNENNVKLDSNRRDCPISVSDS